MNRALARVVFVVVAMGGACQPISGVEAGRALFFDPRVSRSEFNTVACATCHDDGTADPTVIFAGHPLQDVVFRPSWWGGQAGSLKDAVDHCLVFFMRERPLAADDPRGRALYEYLLAISTRTASPAQPLTIVENVTSVGRGDPRNGEEVWNRACASCHGAPHTGEGRLSDLVSIVPEDSVAFAEQSGFPLDLVIVEKVRHGGFFGVGGSMPPYALERLSDDELADLLGFLLQDDP